MITNPFRAWLETQPRQVTQTSLAKDIGVDRTYICDLMSEGCTLMPSLPVSIAIERRTHGKVKAATLHDFAQGNRAKDQEQAA